MRTWFRMLRAWQYSFELHKVVEFQDQLIENSSDKFRENDQLVCIILMFVFESSEIMTNCPKQIFNKGPKDKHHLQNSKHIKSIDVIGVPEKIVQLQSYGQQGNSVEMCVIFLWPNYFAERRAEVTQEISLNFCQIT